MTMQLRGGPFNGKVSAKGLELLEKIARDADIRARCVFDASRRITTQKPKEARWMVLHVWPGREGAVEKMLDEQDIEACTPVCKGPKRRRHHKELPPSEKPVFIGYTFVRCVPSEYALQALLGFEHVRGIVGGWERPLNVSDEIINHFKDMAAKGAYDWDARVDAGSAVFPKGCQVMVEEGPFARFVGTVVAFGGTGKGTPVVELDIFGRQTPMMIPLAMLSRV